MNYNKIKELLEVTRNPFQIRREHGFKLSEIRELMQDLEPLEGWGRVQLQPFIISRKRHTAPWPAEDLACIQEHRRLHDQGRVTMCQGRDGQYTIQYAIPCKNPKPRAPYFYGAPA